MISTSGRRSLSGLNTRSTKCRVSFGVPDTTLPPSPTRWSEIMLSQVTPYFVVTDGSRLPQLGWEALAVIAAVVAVCLALVLLPWSGPAGVDRAIAMTTTVRSLSLALFVASAASATVVLTLLAYGLLMYGLSVPVAWRLARSTSPAPTS